MPDVEASGHDPFVSSDAEAFAPDPRLTPYGGDHTIARAEVEASSCSNPMACAMRDDHDTHLTSLNFTYVGITPSGVVLTQHGDKDGATGRA